jgi:hypothetical protein
VLSLLPPMLCIGSTTITTGNEHARQFVNALCLSIRNKMIVFSSLNDVELFHSMFVDCRMLKSREWGPMADDGNRHRRSISIVRVVGIVSSRSSSPYFAATATTHLSPMMSLPG